jgi:hypothetical protein
MSNYEEIKKLVDSSRKIFSNLNESAKNDIRSKYGMINEQPIDDKKEVISDEPKKDSDDIGTPRDKQKAYRIQGNILVLHGKEESDLQLTTDEKNAFTESVDEFRGDVAELVEFGKLNIFDNNVEWSGKILELNLEFFYTINEPHGIYINGQMVKIDQEYLEMVGKIQTFYEKFKTKWSKIVASRQDKI